MKKARAKTARKPAPQLRRALEYKVVELSTVDEGSLEGVVNDWVRRGWAFDGLQFAMRESSKRPSMAFAFFTRPGELLVEPSATGADGPGPAAPRAAAGESAWTRLQRLAGDHER